MLKSKDLLILHLSKTAIECIFVCGKSTLKNITIKSTVTYSLNQSDTIIYEIPSVIQTIKKYNYSHDLIAWVINGPFIETTRLDPNEKLPTNNIKIAHHIYHENNTYYADAMSQALLLQIRLISYYLNAYCLNPISRFFLLKSVYNMYFFNLNNSAIESFSPTSLEQFFNYKNVQKIIPLQKNIDPENYHSYILVYGLLSIYAKQEAK